MTRKYLEHKRTGCNRNICTPDFSVLELVLDQGEEWKNKVVRSGKMNVKCNVKINVT